MRTVTVLSLIVMTACATVRPVTAPATFIPQHHPDRIWVAAPNGEVLQLIGPALRGDSVVGTLAGTSEPLAVPLTPDYHVFARQPAAGRTAQLVGVVGVIGGLAIWGFAQGGNGEKGCATPGMRGCPPQ
jgi:hypothetical protein